jgi:hypothetical protein
MKVKDFLTKDKWCQHNMAQDCHGNTVPVNDATAVQWCLLGAIEKIYGSTSVDNPMMFRLARALILKYPHLRGLSIGTINDYFGYDAIKELVDQADI